MKKIAIFLVCIFLTGSIVACDQSSNKKTSTSSEKTTTQTVKKDTSFSSEEKSSTEDEELKKAEKIHKDATRTEILDKGDNNEGEIRIHR